MSTITVETLELLASKICHDLISPIGAVNNGIEIMEEMGPDAGAEVTELIAFSAGQASAKLQAYRMAYGAGGADGHHKPEDVYNAIEDIIRAEKKITQDWDPKAPVAPEILPTAFCKMLAAMLLLTMECLPKGGALTVEADQNGETVITGRGEDAALKKGFAESLSLTIDSATLEPGMTHAYMTGLLAKHYGYTIKPGKPEAGTITFSMSLPTQ